MKNLHYFLFDSFQQAVQQAYPLLSADLVQNLLEITLSSHEKFGHYQCNSAMKLAKLLKQPPRQVAENIVKAFDLLQKKPYLLEIAGPGFINITFSPSFLSEKINFLLHDSRLGVELLEENKKIVVDFSSPNVAKEMHVGHLRSTIIGDCLARLFEFLGYEVLRLNHVGDWGTSLGMLIAYLKEEKPEVLTGDQAANLTDLMNWYRLSKKRFDENLDFKTKSQKEVVALQKGDFFALQAWKLICQISREAYREIYTLLDVSLIERGESYYNCYLPKIVKDLEEKELVELSNGAKCIFLEGFQNREGEPLPLMIQKSDGGYNYATTDMATLYQRVKEEKAKRLIYVTDAGQSTHFQMIFKAAEKAGYLDRQVVQVDHVPFGLVLGNDGKKFRTRSGDTEPLINLLQAAIDQADQILQNREPNRAAEERYPLAKALGIGAVKYADLSSHRTSDYIFSYEKMLRFEGNTAAFLLYSYVRILGIKRKVKKDLLTLIKLEKIILDHPSEVDLGLHLLRFQDALKAVADDLLPHRLTDYLYTLAEKFNVFFRDCRVEGSQQEHSRLLLCEITSRILEKGLKILGLSVVDRM